MHSQKQVTSPPPQQIFTPSLNSVQSLERFILLKVGRVYAKGQFWVKAGFSLTWKHIARLVRGEEGEVRRLRWIRWGRVQTGGSRLFFGAHGLQEDPVWTEDTGSGPAYPDGIISGCIRAFRSGLHPGFIAYLPFFLCPQQFVPNNFLFQFIALMFNFSLIYIY